MLPSSIQHLHNVRKLYLDNCTSLVMLHSSIQHLHKLDWLIMRGCTSLVMLPSSIQHVDKLTALDMKGCTSLEVLPTNINLVRLLSVDVSGCSRLTSFPQISTKIRYLYLSDTGIEEVPSWIENIAGLTHLTMTGCKKLKIISANIFKLEYLEYADFTDCGSLTSFIDLVELEYLEKVDFTDSGSFDNCTSLVMLPSSIQHLHKLWRLDMSGCTSLEVFPTNINLVSLHRLDLSGCSRLTSFPQLSTNIGYLRLDDTGIEEVPSWIENIAGLTLLSKRGCKKLRKISATTWNLKDLERAAFTDYGNLTSVSNASLVKTVTELHAESIENYTEDDMYPRSRSNTEFRFDNCFNLDRDAREFILQSDFRYAVLPIKQVPTFFTHRSCGSSLIVPLPQSSLSQDNLGINACIILDNTDFFRVIVHWKFRGVTGRVSIDHIGRDVSEMDHLFVFNFNFCCSREEVDDPPSQLDCNNVEFEFEIHNYYFCRCYTNHGTKNRNLLTCPILPHNIKGCGVRVVSVSPSKISEQQDTETPIVDPTSSPQLINFSRQLHQEKRSQSVKTESERSNKRMRMTVIASQEHSNILCGQTEDTGMPAPNLDLSLGLCGVSSNFGNGTPLSPYLEAEASCVVPMITEQQDTEEKPTVNPLVTPQLINFFR